MSYQLRPFQDETLLADITLSINRHDRNRMFAKIGKSSYIIMVGRKSTESIVFDFKYGFVLPGQPTTSPHLKITM